MGKQSRRKNERRWLRTAAPLLVPTRGRSCGDCQECCSVLAVLELGKPPRQRCPHQCDVGCSAYENRPVDCRNFRCFWLGGLFGEEHRPDKCGLVVHGSTNETRAQLGYSHVFVATALPWAALASTEPRRAVLDAVAKTGCDAFVTCGGVLRDPTSAHSSIWRAQNDRLPRT